jgi:integrase/recombinase XerC
VSFEEALRSFDVWLRAERNLAENTRRAYLADVRQFAAFLGEGARPEQVTPERVFAFLADLHGRVHPSTSGRKLAALRSFFRQRVREGDCASDPSAGIPSPRVPRPWWSCSTAAGSAWASSRPWMYATWTPRAGM